MGPWYQSVRCEQRVEVIHRGFLPSALEDGTYSPSVLHTKTKTFVSIQNS